MYMMISILSNRKERWSAKKVLKKGFTLVELMVTIAIFVFMTAVILAKYNSFYSGTIFKNIAYDFALTIRQAQTYGISVKINDTGGSNYNLAYGVSFDATTVYDKNKKFSLNSFKNDNTLGNTEKTYNLKHGAVIRYVHSMDVPGPGIRLSDLDIIFRRPNPEAIICGTFATVRTCGYKTAKITIRSADGLDSKYVYVNSAGQILVSDSLLP
jgi:prepilin-type N-terminal cleavage/methylation domain-containing protein